MIAPVAKVRSQMHDVCWDYSEAKQTEAVVHLALEQSSPINLSVRSKRSLSCMASFPSGFSNEPIDLSVKRKLPEDFDQPIDLCTKRRSSQGDARQSTGSIAPQTVNLDAHFKVIAPPFSHLQSGNEQVVRLPATVIQGEPSTCSAGGKQMENFHMAQVSEHLFTWTLMNSLYITHMFLMY